jgi:hypothetical protein
MQKNKNLRSVFQEVRPQGRARRGGAPPHFEKGFLDLPKLLISFLGPPGCRRSQEGVIYGFKN